MTFDEILKHLNGKGISIDAAPLTAYLQSIGMSADQVQPSLLKSIEADLQKAIAPTGSQNGAMTPKSSRKPRGRKKSEIATPETPIAAETTQAGQADADAIVERLYQEVDPLVGAFDQARTEVVKDAGIHILQSIAALQPDTLDLVRRGLEVMPVQSFRFNTNANDVGAST